MAATNAPASLLQAPSGVSANGRYYNPVVMSFIRDDWVQQQLHLRQSAYTVFHRTSVVTGTWNVNAKKPLAPAEAAKILHWVQQKTGTPKAPARQMPDIVALGFQEIVDLNAVNVVVNNQSAQRSAAWEEAILAALNQHLSAQQYKVVLEKHLVGILLLVFVRMDHVNHVKDVSGATAGVGIMGMMGNKGGAAVRMTFYDSTLCFVCAHLAAHRENVAGRNADYLNILSKIEFDDHEDPSAAAAASEVRFYTGEPAILNHDFVFWLGDLNYRILDDVSTEECFQMAESGDLHELVQRDQLLIERKRGNVFHGFEEGPLSFPPTYKFQAGTSQYEKRPEKKLRAPAWCDRILWKAKTPAHVTLQHYNAVMALDLSDHKPVHAFFEIQVKQTVESKKNQVVKEIMLQLDKWENENMPKVRLLQGDKSGLPSTGVLGFTHLKYGLSQTKSIIVENTGLVVAHFRFIPKLEEVRICRPWLTVSPSYGMIPPKERIELRITALVNESIAHGLSSGDESLDDTMILRIENGRDYFLVVSGQYDASCFGNSLERLVLCHEPVRQAQMTTASHGHGHHHHHHHHHQQHPHHHEPAQAPDLLNSPVMSPVSSPRHHQEPSSPRSMQPNLQNVPKELWRMVDDLYKHFLDEKNLFIEAGNKQELVHLREALDTGTAFPPHSSYSMAELLISWLQSLSQAVVPDGLLATALAHGNGNVAQTCRALLDALPPVRYNVIIYIVSFLKEVLKRAAGNRLTPEKLAYVFSRCLVTPCKEERAHNHLTTQYQADASGHGGDGQPVSRVVDAAQWNANQRAERMERMLYHMLTTATL
ncbi:TPA: hypothetical protein N0F65_007907 [Lagenidium giganteum]|uniref:Rho-GAP domain-containing protein n=1 Tax=Lagenidium giganteum TaxID=4803 RepID=A0AAV2YZZ8_9STRA|nr:TPA: hypothetical protein N0F65_007907 [Lagenidium giganteum]